ncbi:MAG TPA: DUF3179 domain-containing (seleno)protein [Chitinophagaceae bacterium]|jgi:hypothetical protein|nr:DUF3179 domain-containing (seleno)protein [Chitinophagaceae bacterium]
MKKYFWFGLIALLLFEIANVYFIMPMPGSQQMDSIDLAYFLYKWRWIFRGLFAAMIFIGLFRTQWKRKWLLFFPIAVVAAAIYMTNFVMAADAMFKQPKQLLLVSAESNKVDSNRLVLGVSINGEAKAYPIQFLGYHHHIQDTVGNKPIMVTYCTVCRTGRVFEPIVNGKKEKFRLVGMDHFNAMLEDATTKSWWRQVTGEAITGKLKGQQLPEVYSIQTSLAAWLQLNPNSLIMQADENFIRSYDSTFKFESGASKSKLTGTDSLSWKDKSWVIGVKAGKETKAYDWNKLKKEKLMQDKIGATPVIIVLSNNDKSFFAFERPTDNSIFNLSGDTLLFDNHKYRIDGKGIDTSFSLKPLPASQEFWHSWRTFNPGTLR